jgi:hypothetical protein
MSTPIPAHAGLRVMSLSDYEQVTAARQEFVDFLLGASGLPALQDARPPRAARL